MSQFMLSVFTGDVVRSSRLGPSELDHLLDRLRSAADETADWIEGDFNPRFTRFRGDGWQCLAPSPALSLRTMLYFRACLRSSDRGFDTRISVGIGSGDQGDFNDLSRAVGSAFEISGHGLDTSRGPARWLAKGESVSADRQSVIALCDEISRRWTKAQARVFRLRLLLGYDSQIEIAAKIGVSQQMVAKHLSAGGAWALSEAVAGMEAVEWK